MCPSTLLVALSLLAVEDPITVDARRQLFLDDYLIASSQNVTRVIHPATKHPDDPVLAPSEPWEGNAAILYGSVLADEGRYRMWYLTGGGVAYAESDDGIRWRKPPLGVVKKDGRDTNLVVLRDAPPDTQGAMPLLYENFGVLRDDRDLEASRRYKLGFLSIQRDYDGPMRDPYHGNQRRGLGVAVSPDGIHWRLENNWATQATCDGPTHWMFDPAGGRYVLYGRTKYALPEVAAAAADKPWLNFWGRSVIRTESEDFVHWKETKPDSGELVLTPDTRDPVGSEIYSMMVFPYEGVYIGLVQMFHKERDTCRLEIELAVSRDTVHFTRVGDRAAFIPVGPEGSWDRFNNSLPTNPPLPVGDTLRFYYGGRSYRHSPYNGPQFPYHGKDRGEARGAIGLATIPRDRFVSMRSGADEGQIVTPPVRLAAGQLHLNANAAGGWIRVEVFAPDGHVVARSERIDRDALDIPVTWEQGSLEGLEGPVTLRITLQNAEVFALWCR
ncbi:MAG: hypothetical protein NTW96_03575 [Planctomycetia bacterium]|nr:hypothetical protein [Planctomycetia bacterium]